MNQTSSDDADRGFEKQETKNWHDVILSMGSNLGDRLLILRQSLQQLELNEGIEITKVSSVYETDPLGFTDQPTFYNIAVSLKTQLSPHKLLEVCQRVEKQFHRERKVRWGPRTIDIDIIIYDDITIDSADLTIPHPRRNEREFVMLPLEEIKTGQVQASKTVRPVYSNWF